MSNTSIVGEPTRLADGDERRVIAAYFKRFGSIAARAEALSVTTAEGTRWVGLTTPGSKGVLAFYRATASEGIWRFRPAESVPAAVKAAFGEAS